MELDSPKSTSLCVWNDQLYSGLSDGNIKKWNNKGECTQILKGHTSPVYCLTIWNDFLVSGSNDKTIKLWNSQGECVDTLNEHIDYVNCLIVWNNSLYSGSMDKTIRKWEERDQVQFNLKYLFQIKIFIDQLTINLKFRKSLALKF